MSASPPIADVLLVLPVLHPSGAERVVAELATRLPALGFPTSVLCLEDENAAVGVELKNAGVRVNGLHLSRRMSFACGRAIAQNIMTTDLSRPRIVCAHLYHANIAVRIAAKNMPKSARQHVRILTTVHVAERRFRPWQFLADRITAKHAAREICIANSVAEFQRKKTGLPESFFRVIENGIDVIKFAKNSVTKTVGGTDVLRVVSVGRLNDQKDYPTLLRAWKTVRAAQSRAQLEIAGTGPEQSRLKALCTDMKLEGVRFIGFCGDVPGFLAGAVVYVQSSAWEGMPLTVLEAMAAGLPVIASAVDSLPDVIENGRTGLLFERGNHAAIAQNIITLLADPARANTIGNAARETALKRFSADRMAADYAALFNEILSERPA